MEQVIVINPQLKQEKKQQRLKQVELVYTLLELESVDRQFKNL